MARKYNKKRGARRKKSTKRSGRKRQGGKRRSGKRSKGAFVNALKKLSSLRPPQRVEAMKMANNNFVRKFCQNVNSLRRARLSPSLRKRLQRKSKKLRKLVSPKTSVGSKRKMLTQRGGFLSLLLPIVLKAAFGI